MIADASGAIAIAGVIGGADSAISETTTRIVLESANFNAASVRLTSSRHKLRTDASMRFEKSLDPTNTVRGLARAAQLLKRFALRIRVVGGVVDSSATLPALPAIELPVDFVVHRLGKQISEAAYRLHSRSARIRRRTTRLRSVARQRAILASDERHLVKARPG